MPKASWNGQVVAQSEKFETVEGNVYFPPDTVDRQYFTPSSTTSRCPWKGTAHYYNVVVNGQENKDAAWFYPEPLAEARNIKDHVAFWRGVQVEK
jgi:uncharacterized protein (DUF427 family)